MELSLSKFLPHFAKNYREMRLILGDQLNIRHSWFEGHGTGVIL